MAPAHLRDVRATRLAAPNLHHRPLAAQRLDRSASSRNDPCAGNDSRASASRSHTRAVASGSPASSRARPSTAAARASAFASAGSASTRSYQPIAPA